mmetsp:Transcript_19882/g.69042  ORF Transcript_19882/g.69042 Transcript_19882/m.69042 type:complete len:98 (+) Transcript_19882:1015-1308(+)
MRNALDSFALHEGVRMLQHQLRTSHAANCRSQLAMLTLGEESHALSHARLAKDLVKVMLTCAYVRSTVWPSTCSCPPDADRCTRVAAGFLRLQRAAE